MPTSEKIIEKFLVAEVAKFGGWAFKLPCTYVAGLPDRLCLLPGGFIFFAEVKTTGKKPTAIQELVHKKLRKLGFNVYVIDSLDLVNSTLNTYLE